MTRDEIDEWMSQRGFVPLDKPRAGKSPEELERVAERKEKVRRYLERSQEHFVKILREVLTKNMTREEARELLAEYHHRLDQEFGISQDSAG